MLDQLERDNLYEDFIYLNYDLGLIFSSLAGYDIRESVKVWERMKEAYKGKMSFISSSKCCMPSF